MRHSLLLSLTALSLGLTACGEPADQQLESVQLEIDSNDGLDPWTEVELSGQVTVDGAGRDLVLTIDGAEEQTEIGVHTPGLSDLTTLAGFDVDVTVLGDTMIVTDDDGVLYAADAGGSRWLLGDHFGQDFVDHGATIRQVLDGTELYTYTTVVFQTDEGEVEFEPGDTGSIKMDGHDYRVAVIAAYTVDETAPIAVMCGGTPPVLSYEMLRVAESVEPNIVERPEGLEMARLAGCGG
jgi:hypothetical protein